MTPEETKRLAELEAKRANKSTSGLDVMEMFGRGSTLGWGDEISSMLMSPFLRLEGESMGDAYTRLQRMNDQRYLEQDQNNPVLSPVLKGLGGIATGIATAPTLLGSAPSLLRTGVIGVGEASLIGAGESTEETLGGVALDAAKTAPFGLLAPAGQALGRFGMNLFGGKTRTSSQIIDDAMKDIGLDTKTLFGKLDDLGQEASLFDTYPAFKMLGQGSLKTPGALNYVTDVLENRANSMSQRVLEKLSKASPTMKRITQEFREQARSRANTAKPLYEKAYRQSIDLDPELMDLLKRPSVAKAWREAQQDALEEGRQLPDIFELIKNKSGEIVELKPKKIPDMEAWDTIKKGLDKVIQKNGKNPLTGRMTEDGRLINNTKNQLLDILDSKNTYYKAARDSWAGDSQILEAMENGRKLLSMSTDEVLDITDKLSKGEREAMLKGVVSDIVEKIGRKPEDTAAAYNFMRSQNAKIKLRAVFGDEPQAQQALNSLLKQIDTERVFAQSRADAIKNSLTSQRDSAKQFLETAVPTQSEVMNITGAAQRGIMKLLQKQTKLPKAELDNMAKVIFKPGITRTELDAVLKDAKLSADDYQGIMSLLMGTSTGTATLLGGE